MVLGRIPTFELQLQLSQRLKTLFAILNNEKSILHIDHIFLGLVLYCMCFPNHCKKINALVLRRVERAITCNYFSLEGHAECMFLNADKFIYWIHLTFTLADNTVLGLT